MIDLDYEEVVKRIVDKTGKPREEVEGLIDEKIKELNGLVSKNGAAHILANELGIVMVNPSGKISVSNIVPGMRNVEVTGRVVRKYEAREFSTEKRSGRIGSFLLGDNTGIIRVVLWDDMVEYLDKIKEGDTIKIVNAYSRKNRDRREIHVTNKARIIIGVEETIEMPSPRRVSLAELNGGEENIEVYATIVQVFEPRFFEVCPQCGKRLKLVEGSFSCPVHGVVEPDYRMVLNTFIDDGTSSLRLVLWEPQILKMLGVSRDELLGLKDNPGAVEELRQKLLGRIIRVIGRASRNEAFDRVELIANIVELDPNPPEDWIKPSMNEDSTLKEERFDSGQ